MLSVLTSRDVELLSALLVVAGVFVAVYVCIWFVDWWSGDCGRWTCGERRERRHRHRDHELWPLSNVSDEHAAGVAVLLIAVPVVVGVALALGGTR